MFTGFLHKRQTDRYGHRRRHRLRHRIDYLRTPVLYLLGADADATVGFAGNGETAE